MATQNGYLKSNLVTNVLLGIITVLLIILIVWFASSQRSNASRVSANAAIDAANREALVNKISQISQENQAAIDDLYHDYVRDRGYRTEDEEDYLLLQGIVGDEYIIHGLMFLAKQNNQILELLAEIE